MVRAPGVHVPRADAEATRRELQDEGVLRDDLQVMETEEGIVFPVQEAFEGAEPFEFTLRARRPRHYTELLDWAKRELDLAPRAFDAMGDIIVVKVPQALWDRREQIGRALHAFLPATRAVFHDHGVQGEHRTRALERIYGDGGSETEVRENGVTLRVDPAAAYFSPRLASERARLAGLLAPGDRVVDLFAGVAPFGVQAARAGAEVVCVDINPDACRLARHNAQANKVTLEVVCGDAREVAGPLAPADHVVTNLPHSASGFLPVSVPLVKPGGTLHHHEVMGRDALDERCKALLAAVAKLGRHGKVTATRHVRDYSTTEAHVAIDIRIDEVA